MVKTKATIEPIIKLSLSRIGKNRNNSTVNDQTDATTVVSFLRLGDAKTLVGESWEDEGALDSRFEYTGSGN